MIQLRAIPKDPVLLELRAVLDTSRMASEFERELFGGEIAKGGNALHRHRVKECQIERVKYKPGYNCLINYRLIIEDEKGQNSHEQILCARHYTLGASVSRFEKAQDQKLYPPAFGPPLFHIEALSLVVWAFPNDRKLEGLLILRDAARLQNEILPPLVQSRFGEGWVIDDLTHTIAHFEPEHTCCLRVELTLVQNQTNAIQTWVLFGKTYYDGLGEEAYRNMEQLWESGPRSHSGSLSIPRPLAYLPQYRMLWQEGIAGETVLERHPNYLIDDALVVDTADAIATLHRTPIATERYTRLNDVVDRLQELVSFLSEVEPSCKETLSGVVERLVGTAPHQNQATATLHGDLHLRNVFVDDQGVSLIDLDTLSVGPPLHDIGTFIAILLNNTSKSAEERSIAKNMIDTFLKRYRSQVPWEVSATDVNWYTGATLITICAFRCVKRLESGWPSTLTRVINLADHVTGGDSG